MTDLTEFTQISDQIDDDLGVIKGALDLMAGTASSRELCIESSVLPVLEDLDNRVKRIGENADKLWNALRKQPEEEKGNPKEEAADEPEIEGDGGVIDYGSMFWEKEPKRTVVLREESIEFLKGLA